MRWLGRRAPQALCLFFLATLAGCSTASPSTLSPSGPKSGFVAWAWWLLFGVAAFVCVAVITLAVLAVVFRRRATEVKSGEGKKVVMVFGAIIPALVFSAAFALSVSGIAVNDKPSSPERLTIDVTGHQWWWEVSYDGTRAVTANEIHIPVGTPVRLRLRTADVIHSFWVPQLMPKVDLLPERVNQTWVTANKPGTYRGQCAEYCGIEHAHMAFEVVAQPKAEFRRWLANQATDAPAPSTPEQRRGREIVSTSTCATCHTVRGTEADGDVGPDLTHVGSRDRLAAGAIPNDFGHMSGWVANSQTVKPGNKMPPQPLSPDDLRAVVSYLQSLR